MEPFEGYSIIYAPICSNCRKIITDLVYVEKIEELLAMADDKSKMTAGYFHVHPEKCRNCGVEFEHLIGPGSHFNPYNIDEIFRKYGQEESGNVS